MSDEANDDKDLTAQELVFVGAVVGGSPYTEAYRQAYGAENYSDNALRVQASRKASQAHIQKAISEVQAVTSANIALTLERRIAEEYAFHHECRRTGNMGAAGGAFDRINKLAQMYVEQHADVTPDPLQTLQAIARANPQLARALAEQEGIPWDTEDGTRH